MSFLSCASSNSIYKGYDYYTDNRVQEFEQVEKCKFKSVVIGSENHRYNVLIDTDKPKTSLCDCPHAEGSRVICKHKIATFFYLREDIAEKFGASLRAPDLSEFVKFSYNRYDDEYEEYYDRQHRGWDDYDEYDDYGTYSYEEEIPDYFETILNDYVNEMSLEELKSFVKKELNKNKKYTLNYVIQDKQTEYLNKHKEVVFLDKLKNEVKQLITFENLDYYEYNKQLFSKKRKEELIGIIHSSLPYRDEVIKILCTPALALYNDYSWVIDEISDVINNRMKKEFIDSLEDFSNALRHVEIDGLVSRSNVLTVLFKLKNNTSEELARLLVDNNYYYIYVQNIVNSFPDSKKLLDDILKLLEKNYVPTSHENIYDLITSFYNVIPDSMDYIQTKACFYEFVINATIFPLKDLKKNGRDEVLEKLFEMCKDDAHKLSQYEFQEDYDALYELVKKINKTYLYDKYIDVLKYTHSLDLYRYYKELIYKELDKGMGREYYKEVGKLCKSIKKLDGNKEYLNTLVDELKKSNHGKKPALFDEIYKATDYKYRSYRRY